MDLSAAEFGSFDSSDYLWLRPVKSSHKDNMITLAMNELIRVHYGFSTRNIRAYEKTLTQKNRK